MKNILLTLLFFLITSAGYTQFSATTEIGFGGTLPYGDFKNLYDPGFSLEVSGNYDLHTSGLSLIVSSGFNSFTFNNSFVNLKINNVASNSKQFNESWSLNNIPLMVGVRCILSDPSTIVPYGTFELGIDILTYSSRNSGNIYIDTVSGNLQYPKENKTKIFPGFIVGFGTEISFLKVIKFDIGFQFNQLFGEYYSGFNITRNNQTIESPSLRNASFMTYSIGFKMGLF